MTERFTQVMDSMPWVRCASGNVSCICYQAFLVFIANVFLDLVAVILVAIVCSDFVFVFVYLWKSVHDRDPPAAVPIATN